MYYLVNPIVCDYGVYSLTDENEKALVVICNSLSNATLIADILNSDNMHEIY